MGNNVKKVLIVEDNPLIQKITSHLLQQYGFEVETTDKGLEAVKLVKHRDYDFILLDFGLPDIRGSEAARLIRKHERKYLCPPCLIAIFSASTDTIQEKECLEAGVNWILQKPLTAKILEQVEEYLKRV